MFTVYVLCTVLYVYCVLFTVYVLCAVLYVYCVMFTVCVLCAVLSFVVTEHNKSVVIHSTNTHNFTS
jgi:hypothetical protein